MLLASSQLVLLHYSTNIVDKLGPHHNKTRHGNSSSRKIITRVRVYVLHDNIPTHKHVFHELLNRKFKLKFVCLIFGIWGCKIIQLFMHKCHKTSLIMHAMSMINLLNPIIERGGMSQIDRLHFMNFMSSLNFNI